MTAAPSPDVLQLRSSAGLYGADRVAMALDAALPAAGVHSRLLVVGNHRMATQPLHAAARAGGRDARLLPCRARLDPRTHAALAQALRAAPGAVVHVHDYKSAFHAWLAARAARPPGRRRPLVATLHGWIESDAALRLYTRVELALLRRFDAVVVVSADMVPRLLRAGIGAARIHRIDNGIVLPAPTTEPGTADASGARAALGLPASGPLLAAIGRLAPEKHLVLLVDAFASVAEAHPLATLLLVGDGPERAALEARVAAHGLHGRVRLLGQRDEVQPLYPLLHAVVLPSLREGMPLVVLEAMAHGVPVIASDVGDVPRLLAHADHGRLLAPGDGNALARALHDALSAPRRHDLRARLHVARTHGASAMARAYAALYGQLRDPRSAPTRDDARAAHATHGEDDDVHAGA